MVAAVLTLLWRQVPGVQELNRLLAREGLLWCNPTKVAQQSLSERFLVVLQYLVCQKLSKNPMQSGKYHINLKL